MLGSWGGGSTACRQTPGARRFPLTFSLVARKPR